MRKVVKEAFHAYSHDLEGVLGHLYLDVLNLVTTAMGVLIEPIGAVEALPLLRPDGTPASIAEKRADWQRVKARKDLSPRGGVIFRTVAQLHMTPAGIEAVTEQRLRILVGHLRRTYVEWDGWPSDAQLAALSMGWAVGGAFYRKFPRMAAALKRRDWQAAADESRIRGGGTIPKRNDRCRKCLENAAKVADWGLPPEPLHWPSVPAPPSIPVVVVDDAETEPDRHVGPGSPGYEATSDAVHDAARRHLERERE